MSTTSPLPVHLYAATIANSDYDVYRLLHLSLPMKYYDLYADASMAGYIPRTDKGSVQLFFMCDHKTASRIRKWLDRRFNGSRGRLSLTGRRQRDLKFARCCEGRAGGLANLAAFPAVGA